MKNLENFYQEIDRLKQHNLVSSVIYKISNAKRADLPYTYNEIVSIYFMSTIDNKKIVDVLDYLRSEYIHETSCIEWVEMRTSHSIDVCVIRREQIS